MLTPLASLPFCPTTLRHQVKTHQATRTNQPDTMKTIPTLSAATFLLAAFCSSLSARLVEPVAIFDYAHGELPESLAFDHEGNAFMSIASGGKIVKVSPTGVKSDFAQIADWQLLGVKFDAAGNLFVAGGNGIWKVTRDGSVSMFATVPGHFFLNDMAFDRAGNMYVTDSFAYSIWRIDPAGNAQVWSTDPLLLPSSTFFPFPLGPNGLSFSRDGRTLFVLNTCAGRVVAIDLDQSGGAGAGRLVAEDEALIGADGLTMDATGNLFIAVNIQDQIVVLDTKGQLTELVSGRPLSTPTTVVFGERSGQQTLFICNNGNFFAGADATLAGLYKIDSAGPFQRRAIQNRR